MHVAGGNDGLAGMDRLASAGGGLAQPHADGAAVVSSFASATRCALAEERIRVAVEVDSSLPPLGLSPRELSKLLDLHTPSPKPAFLANLGPDKRLITGVAVFQNEPFNDASGS